MTEFFDKNELPAPTPSLMMTDYRKKFQRDP
jgi:hypothetical protein